MVVAGAPLGLPVGILYGVTTISGPPLALIFNNNGLAKDEFKAAMSIVRTTESTLTFISYTLLGIFTPDVLVTVAYVAPIIVVFTLIGHYLVRVLPREDFRRLTMSFDAWIVGYGLSNVLSKMRPLPDPYNYMPLIMIVTIDSLLLYRYFTVQRQRLMIDS
ncbi:MAG: hypothetical protein QW452_02410 [Pyrobaculum sp.]